MIRMVAKIGEEYKGKEILEDILKKERNVVDLIIEMKNLAALAIELGFSALLFQDKKLVDKIRELEEEIDVRQYEIETECMLVSKTPKEALELTSVLRVASAIEDISNAVKELTDSLSRGIPIHPTILKGLKQSLDTISYIEIKKNSKAIGKTLDEVTQGKVDIIGLKREGKWIYLPKRVEIVKEGDILILSGRRRKLAVIEKSI